MRIAITILLFSSFFLVSCNKDEPITEASAEIYSLQVPQGFQAPEIPEDNPLTPAKIALGKALFYDPILSKDNTISCGSCHMHNHGFSDDKALSIGVEGKVGERNSPTLTNVAYKPHFFKDGGIPTLELQILAPFDNELEFDLNIVDAVDRLKADDHYSAEFQKVFGSEPSAFGLTRAIAAFERTLLSGNSRFDQHFIQGKSVLTDAELRGYELFKSEELQCASCHSGIMFTDYSYQNIGLKENYPDSGRARITVNQSDAGKFEVPTLRNVAVTSPYMFDGSIESLDGVIDFFASGGTNHPNKSELIQGFEISDQEKADLIAFLNSLTDQSFLSNQEFQP